jgi:transposase InsO family protein
MIHTDQGSQYTGKEFQKRLADKEITCSTSRKGNYWDNAVVESFFAALKNELEILEFNLRLRAVIIQPPDVDRRILQ